jgi:hypothetical protein
MVPAGIESVEILVGVVVHIPVNVNSKDVSSLQVRTTENARVLKSMAYKSLMSNSRLLSLLCYKAVHSSEF